jgi:hypothetical protein
MKCFEFKMLYSSCKVLSHSLAITSHKVIYLSRSIDNLSRIVLAVVFDNSAEGVLNGRVIAFDEVMLDKADRE